MRPGPKNGRQPTVARGGHSQTPERIEDMFGLSELRDIEAYAIALYTSGIRRAPLSDSVAAEWASFHELFGKPRQRELSLAPIFSEINPRGNAMIMPRVPLALSRAAMFPVPSTAGAAQHGDLPAAADFKRLLDAPDAPADELAIYAYEPLYAWMQRFATHLPATVGGPSL